MKIILLSCIGTDRNISNPNLIHHFLNYYSDLGIDEWAITLHNSGDPDLDVNRSICEQILTDFGISYRRWTGPFNTFVREAAHNRFVARQSDDTWVVGVDLDEFVVFPKKIPLFLKEVDEQGFNCVSGRLVDRITATGELAEIRRSSPLQDQFPQVAEVKKNIYRPAEPSAPFEKQIAIKKPLEWGLGHHYISRESRSFRRNYPAPLPINHFAWDHLLLDRIEVRLGDPWGTEYANMIEYLRKYGRLRPEDTVPGWQEC